MMERNDFLEAIREEPGDLFRWGAFADWLEENREPEQAEALRLAAALIAETDDAERREQLRTRLAELLQDPRARAAVEDVRAVLFAETLLAAAAVVRAVTGPVGNAVRRAAAGLADIARTISSVLNSQRQSL